jgi:hypothetical protein
VPSSATTAIHGGRIRERRAKLSGLGERHGDEV